MLRLIPPLCLCLMLAASPVAAAPLTFGAINGADDASGSTEFTACRPTTDDLRRCDLARRSFGGLDIIASTGLLSAEGRVRSLRIELGRGDYELAQQMLVGRYGPPEGWAEFDDGARIGMTRTPQAALITFDFPANAAPAARIDNSLISTVLALIGIGLVLGWLVVRERRVPAVRPVRQRAEGPTAPLSMRETLERRVAEGRELRF